MKEEDMRSSGADHGMASNGHTIAEPIASVSMVERVARAICLASGFDPDESWDATNDGFYPAERKRRDFERARAAIEAMRPERFGDLPEAMCVAGAMHAGGVGTYEEAHDIFGAMITAALAEHSGEAASPLGKE